MESRLQTFVEVVRLHEDNEVPFHLLLLADETVTAICKYLHLSDVFVARDVSSEQVVGAFVLHKLNDEEIEIKNIAVAENFQGQGIGGFLMDTIKQIAREQGVRILWVGTPDSAARQLNFYRKNGFGIAGMRKNFYRENYPEPIYENGIVLSDMVMLRFSLMTGNLDKQ